MPDTHLIDDLAKNHVALGRDVSIYTRAIDEIQQLGQALHGLTSYALSARNECTEEWMTELLDYINRACAALGDKDRFELVKQGGELFYRKVK